MSRDDLIERCAKSAYERERRGGVPWSKLVKSARQAWLADTATILAEHESYLAECGEWRTMESAPKDGTQVLAHCIANGVPYIAVIWWRGDKYKTWPDELGYVWRLAHDDGAVGGFADTLPNPGPTHWQPLPAPPIAASIAASQRKGEVT